MKMARRRITSALIVLTILALSGCKEAFTGKREARGVWVSRFEYAGIDSAKSQARITEIFERARTAKLNMVFFQVRGTGDAYYKSQYEPWAEPLTGTLEKTRAGTRWNMPCTKHTGLGSSFMYGLIPLRSGAGKNLLLNLRRVPRTLNTRNGLCAVTNGKPMALNDHYVNISPGVPDARKHLVNVALDIVNKYDIDGVHFDYVRYPEDSPKLGYSHDSISVARFNSAEGQSGQN